MVSRASTPIKYPLDFLSRSSFGVWVAERAGNLFTGTFGMHTVGEGAQALANDIIDNFGDKDTCIDLDSLGLKNMIQV